MECPICGADKESYKEVMGRECYEEHGVSSYHKGELCRYKPIICQEGYCSDCQIYKEKDNDR